MKMSRRVEHFGPAERERQEHRVPRRHVGGRDLRGIDRAILRHRQIARQRRAAEGGEIHRNLDVAGDAEPAATARAALDLTGVTLPYDTVRAWRRKPSARAIAAAV
jgi:hypothetical protein